ncbi:MAG: methyltransferase [Alphaproteobacteria bacterium]|nr:methyltransferase [Alphaproteobacteria bacterium]
MVALTQDRLLDGRVVIDQPTDGLRATLDTVMIAATVTPEANATIVELGAGSGAALACVLHRRRDLTALAVEAEPELVALVGANCARAGGSVLALAARVEALPLRHGIADWVFTNPPFHTPHSRRPPHPQRRRAMQEDTPLACWIVAAAHLLRPGGRCSLIHRADRLPEVLAALTPRFGAITVLPLWPRANQPARRVLIGATLGSGAPAALLPGLVLHEADGRFTAEADAVLRGGATLPLTNPAVADRLQSRSVVLDSRVGMP